MPLDPQVQALLAQAASQPSAALNTLTPNEARIRPHLGNSKDGYQKGTKNKK